MKQITATAFAAFMALTPAYGDSPDAGDMDQGMDLIEEGAKILMRGLLSEMQPSLDELRELAEEMGPGLLELRGMIEDFSNYHAPEVLPNGDIIIRRKTPLELEQSEDGEVEL